MASLSARTRADQTLVVDGEHVHMAGGAADFEPTHPLDNQFYRIVDVRNPSRPQEVGRRWYPGTRKGDSALPPPRLEPKSRARRGRWPSMACSTYFIRR